jgi:acetyltransferase-like isoleucine patch superfamily enzyme
VVCAGSRSTGDRPDHDVAVGDDAGDLIAIDHEHVADVEHPHVAGGVHQRRAGGQTRRQKSS